MYCHNIWDKPCDSCRMGHQHKKMRWCTWCGCRVNQITDYYKRSPSRKCVLWLAAHFVLWETISFLLWSFFFFLFLNRAKCVRFMTQQGLIIKMKTELKASSKLKSNYTPKFCWTPPWQRVEEMLQRTAQDSHCKGVALLLCCVCEVRGEDRRDWTD